MAAPPVDLDLSGIAIGQPRVPDPIYNALATLETAINSLGNVHIAADAAIATTKLAGGKTSRKLAFQIPGFFLSGTAITLVGWNSYFTAIRKVDGSAALAKTNFRMPLDWDGGNFTVRLRATTDGTAGGVVACSVGITKQAVGSVLPGAATQEVGGNITVSTTTGSVVEQTYAFTGTNFNTTDLHHIFISLDRTAGGDTATNDVFILELLIEYTSSI